MHVLQFKYLPQKKIDDHSIHMRKGFKIYIHTLIQKRRERERERERERDLSKTALIIPGISYAFCLEEICGNSEHRSRRLRTASASLAIHSGICLAVISSNNDISGRSKADCIVFQTSTELGLTNETF